MYFVGHLNKKNICIQVSPINKRKIEELEEVFVFFGMEKDAIVHVFRE